MAGGWPIYTWNWDNADAWRPDYKLTYVRAHLAPDVPCKGTTVTFKYQNPQSGDNVSAGGDNGTYTFTENGAKYSKYNGAMIPDCSTYAKFYSTNNALKTGIAEFKTADGKTYTATFALNFHLPTPGNTDAESKYPLPWEEDYIKKTSSPSPRPLNCASCDADVNKDGNVDISDFSLVKFCQGKTPADSCLNADINKDNNIDDTDRQCWQKNLGSFCKENSKDAGPGFTPLDAPQMIYPQDGQMIDLEGAYMFKVKPVEGASGYLFGLFQGGEMVYENWRDGKFLSSTEFALWENNSFHAKFRAGQIKVMIRALVNNKWTEAREIYITLRSRGQNPTSPLTVEQTSVQQVAAQQLSVSNLPKIQPSQIVVVSDSSASSALQKKVDELQKKLEESQQRQSLLEKQLSQIMTWIKSVFPFFK